MRLRWHFLRWFIIKIEATFTILLWFSTAAETYWKATSTSRSAPPPYPSNPLTLPHGWIQKFVARQIFIQWSRNGEGVSSVQSLSHVWLLGTQWTAAREASLSITNSWSLLKLMSSQSVMPSNHLILCHPLLLLPSIFPSIRVFSNKSVLRIRWPKCWSFSFNISPSNEYAGLTSFRIDWLDILCSKDTFFQITSGGQAFYRKGWRRAIGGGSHVTLICGNRYWFPGMNSSFLPLNDPLVAGQELDCTNMAPGAEILILQWDGNELQSNPCPNFEVQSAYTSVLWLRLSCSCLVKKKKEQAARRYSQLWVFFFFLQVCPEWGFS